MYVDRAVPDVAGAMLDGIYAVVAELPLLDLRVGYLAAWWRHATLATRDSPGALATLRRLPEASGMVAPGPAAAMASELADVLPSLAAHAKRVNKLREKSADALIDELFVPPSPTALAAMFERRPFDATVKAALADRWLRETREKVAVTISDPAWIDGWLDVATRLAALTAKVGPAGALLIS